MKKLLILFLALCPMLTFAKDRVVNVYIWSAEVPPHIIQKFEKDTGIKVNFSTYDSNEIMYAKLKTVKNLGYDVVMPSSYFISHMKDDGMLLKLDKSKLPNLKYIDPQFLNTAYDPHTDYSVPLLWGVTGIFTNDQYYKKNEITHWKQLWEKQFYNKLLLIDDTREVFSMALIALGYSINDENPKHIQEAYEYLVKILPNVKLFSGSITASTMIDEDAVIGMAWNGDAYKAYRNNPHIQYTLPKEGFAIWVDNFAIPKNAPHPDEAYVFINYVINPESCRDITLALSYPTTNIKARTLLPKEYREDSIIYPPKSTLKKGKFFTGVSEKTRQLYEKLWEELKVSG